MSTKRTPLGRQPKVKPATKEEMQHLREWASLIRLAKDTLAILEGSEEWSSDTTDAIAKAAIDAGLATTDRHGMFKSKVSNPKGQP